MRVCAVNGMNDHARALELAAADAEALLRQHHDAAALGRLVGKAGQLRGIGQLVLGGAVHRDELARPAGCPA